MLKKFNVLAAALIICTGIAAYSGSFNGPFVLDDTTSITTNPTIRNLWPIMNVLTTPKANVTVQSRPILNLSLALNYALSHNQVWSYHVVNIIIHLLSALCLFAILRRTFFKKENPIFPEITSAALALCISLLWVIHPLNTEAVTYIIQRAESLTALFLFLTLYFSIRYFESGARSYLFSFAAFVSCLLGMATKEVMVTAPALILIYDRCFISGTFKNSFKSHFYHYLGLFCTWSLLAYLVIQSGGNRGGSIGFGINQSALSYFLTQGEAITRYLILSFWPHPLVFEYGTFTVTNISGLIPWLIVLPLIILSFWAFLKKPLLGFLGAWFFIILSPTSLVPGTSQMIVEHRMYMPLVAVLTLSVCGAYKFSKRYIWLTLERFVAIVFVITILFSSLTFQRNAMYSSGLKLWSQTLKERPSNPLAHYMIAEEYLTRGNLEEAESHYHKAINLNATFLVARERLGELLVTRGKFEDAELEFINSLTINHDFLDSNMNLASLYALTKQPLKALPYIRKALKLDPKNAEAHYNLANILIMLDKTNEAYSEYAKSIELKPNYSQAYYNWANALVSNRQFDAALDKYSLAINYNPTYFLAEYNLGNTFASLHRFKDAVKHYTRTLELNSKFAFAELNLGSALFELGVLDQAELHYTRALTIDSSLDEAKENIRRINQLRKP
jgi:tetratricopeptide (TPR) repeat protein